MPDFPIVDSHLHLYDPERFAFDWMRDLPQLHGRHLWAEFDAARGEIEVEAAVWVEVDAETGRHLEEAAWVSELASSEPRIGAIVACVPLDQGAETARDLEALGEMPKVRGVRHLIQGHAGKPGWALRPEFVEGVRRLPEYGLSFDICIFASQLREATELVSRCPDTGFVLDHLGKPDIRGGRVAEWREDLAALAARPNVTCKISGLATEADHTTWREEELVPLIDHAIEAFGFERAMFGGDWPVSELATDYPRWVRTVERAVAGASEDERRALFGGTARRVYRF